ncbi:MAG: GNAT family N-acetyltransferase [Deltaproteobacteria bacterium]
MDTIYRIETERLILRCWDPADAADVLAVITDSEDHLGAWLPWVANRPRTVEAQAELLRCFRSRFDADREFVFGVFSKTGACLGSLGLHRSIGPNALEIGYWLGRPSSGQGLGTEMVAAACQAAIVALQAHRLEIHCAPDNLPSARIAARLGFTHEGTLSRRLTSGRGVHDMMLWSLWREAVGSLFATPRGTGFDVLGRRVFPT